MKGTITPVISDMFGFYLREFAADMRGICDPYRPEFNMHGRPFHSQKQRRKRAKWGRR